MIAGRALSVGLACALLHNAIMIAGDWMGLHYAASLPLSFVIVVLAGYRLHSGWTFSGVERSGASFVRYALVAAANLPLSLVGMFLLVDVAGLSVPVASPLLTAALAVFNLAGSKWALRAGRARLTHR